MQAVAEKHKHTSDCVFSHLLKPNQVSAVLVVCSQPQKRVSVVFGCQKRAQRRSFARTGALGSKRNALVSERGIRHQSGTNTNFSPFCEFGLFLLRS